MNTVPRPLRWQTFRQSLLICLVGLTACKSDTVSPVDNAFGAAVGRAAFWTSQSATGVVTVSLAGQGTQTINSFRTTAPRCGAWGTSTAVFSDVPAGTYTYTASASGFTTSTGSVTISRDGCAIEEVYLGPGGIGGTANCVFWIDPQNNTPGSVIVNLGGTSRTLTGRFTVPPACGVATAATFSNLSAGSYPYRAFTEAGESWLGSVAVTASGCTTQYLPQLLLTTTANAMFYSTQNLGTVSVTVEGDRQTFSGSFPGGVPACGTSGAATFGQLAVGPHPYAASSTNGRSWSGTVNVAARNCTKVLLQ